MPQTDNSNANTSTSEAKPASQEQKSQGQKGQGKKTTAKKEKAAKPPKEPKPKKEKPVRTTPAHLAKVDKVAASLPQLNDDGNTVVTAAKNLATADICAVVAHLQVEIRRRGITAVAQGQARGEKLEEGARIKVVACQHNPRLIGMTGTVTKVQRVRAYAKLDGKTYKEKEDGRTGDYFFLSDLKVLGVSQSTQGVSQDALRRLTQPAVNVDLNTILDEADGETAATGT